MQVPSPEITPGDILRLHDACRAAVAGGARGIVVTQGTDTLEESAFVLDVLWDDAAPVVFTGAMRNPSLPGSDGPANLRAAIDTALAAEARGCGVLLVFNDEIHAARFVRKIHTSSPAAFASPAHGPIGRLAERRAVMSLRPRARAHLTLSADAPVPEVALLKMGMGDDGRLLAAVGELDYRGLVIEAFGGGHMRASSVATLQRLVEQMPVVLTSRAGSGDVLTSTYGFPGSESDLLAMGLIHGGAYDGLKARLLLALCLSAGQGRDAIARTFSI
jgi:L-asparaginase